MHKTDRKTERQPGKWKVEEDRSMDGWIDGTRRTGKKEDEEEK